MIVVCVIHVEEMGVLLVFQMICVDMMKKKFAQIQNVEK